MVVTLADQPAVAVEPEWQPPAPPQTEGVAVSPISPDDVPQFGAAEAVVTPADHTIEWPAAATTRVSLPSDSVEHAGVTDADGAPRPGLGGRRDADGLPVRVGAAPLTHEQADAGVPGLAQARLRMPEQVSVQISDRTVARALGVEGLLVSVARDDGRSADSSVTLEVDYSEFRMAYGGDWASRLRITMLGKCGGHPARGPVGAGGDCGAITPLATANDYDAGLLAAQVPLSGDGGSTMLAISAEPSGDNGDYTATTLSPAGTWRVSAQTGAFNWSYPLSMVPGVGGPKPKLALSYSSQTVDGRTANTNTQGSWIGDGWSLWPGFIERRYTSCANDMDEVSGQQPNNPYETADKCWFNDNATMSLNGHAGELVANGDGTYRLINDDGTRIELLADTALGNGDNDGEYWKVTTVDGIQYYFGRHRRPAYPSDIAATNSTWTAPVYGNHPGEPCYQAGDFSGSRCTQAWRWNLDYVVDAHGNTMTLFYGRETGAYGRELDPDKRTTYHRAGFLKRIEYGTREGHEHENPTPARVVFDVADRCLPDTACDKDQPEHWPDTPWDQYCAAQPCTDQLAPTFWTAKRLDTVLTQVWRGGSYADVQSWTLRHDWLDAGASDGEGVPMWLSGITRTGHVSQAGGSQTSEPEVTFDPGSTPLANRVDGPLDGKTQLNRWRLKDIAIESGALIGVIYSEQECTLDTVPQPHENTMRCFPQWYGNGSSEAELDWFHKYVVDTVIVEDLTGASPRMETHWDYLDNPAWHYDDSELVDRDKRTWSQWRGYSQVRRRQGLDSQTQSVTEYLYMRGMDGDRAGPTGGTRSVQVTDSQGVSIDDHEAHGGFLRETTTFDGVGGDWVGGTIKTPWRNGPTAQSGPLEAWMTGTELVRSRTALEDGTTRWTAKATSFDSTYGMPVEVDDLGDESTSSDDRCIRYQYARNTDIWMVDKVSRTEVLGVSCDAAAQYPDDVVSDARTFYDNPDTHGADPTRGLPVKVQQVDSWDATTPVWVTTTRNTFDAHGRTLEHYDALDRKTTTTYTPSTGGPVTQVTTVDAAGHTSTATVEPAWQLPTETIDPNGHTVELTYDAFGRLTQVWLPGRDPDTQTPNLTFAYLLRKNAPTAVTTKTLTATGTYRTGITLYDGMLRERQSQHDAPGGGRVITDVVHNSRGLTDWQSKPYYDKAGDPPTTTLVGPDGQADIPGLIDHVYDGAGRTTDEIFNKLGVEQWRTSYGHGGDRVHTTPPAGGTATTTINDARGQTVALRQYHGPTPTGSYDQTTYTYTDRQQLASVTDAAGNTWTYDYDQRGRLVATVDPDAGLTTKVVDAAGQVTTQTNARGDTLAWTYDALGRKTSLRDDSPTGPKRAEWVYDTLPDGIGQLTRSIRHQDGEQYINEVLGYDQAGRPTGTRVSIPTSETGLAGTYDTTMTYQQDGSLYTLTMPAVGDLPEETLVYAYNDVGLQTEIVSGHSTYVYQATHNKLGELTQRVLGNFGGRTVITHIIDEATGRLTNTSATPELEPEVLDLAYEYDHAGNLTRIADSPESSSPDDTQCFQYDHLRRLTQAWTPASTASWNCMPSPDRIEMGGTAPYWRSYDYDVTGNRLSMTSHAVDGGTDTVSTYDYPQPGAPQPHTVTEVATTSPDGNQLDTYTYDPAGNLTERDRNGSTQTLTWSPEGTVTSIADNSTTTEFVYDADGNRLIRRDTDGATLYLNGQELHYQNATGQQTCTRYYEHQGTQIAVRTSQQLTWMVTDHHNTATVAIRDSDLQAQRQRSLPFGQTRGNTPAWWPGDKGFLGGTKDPTGYTHLGARLYDPSLGRFISVDPVMDPTDPQQINGYTYANANPITWSDPTGLLYQGRVCIDYCGSDADAVLEMMLNPSEEAQQTGPIEPGGAGVTLNDTAVDLGWGPYDGLTEEGQAFVQKTTWRANNPVAYEAHAGGPVGWAAGEYDLLAEIVGLADLDRCWRGDLGGCVWTGLGATPAKPLKWGKLAIFGSRGTRAATRNADNAPWQRAFCSFSEDTEVLMADGDTKSIGDIEVGDDVWAKDPETGEEGSRRVLAVWAHKDTLVDLETENGARISTTADHRFWNHTSKRWERADALDSGDELLSVHNTEVTVVGFDGASAQVRLAYNLTVAEVHTYYVLAGSTPVLVHNSCWWTSTQRAGDLGDMYTPGQLTRDPSSQWYHENLTNDQLLDSIKNAAPGDGIVVSRGGTILGGHHRLDELLRRVDNGLIDPNTPIRIEIYGGG